MTETALVAKLSELARGWRDRVDVDPTDPYTEGESNALFECAQTLKAAIHDAEVTQPPHQDRGDDAKRWIDGAKRPLKLDRIGLDSALRIAYEAGHAAALTEAKQQGPGEAFDVRGGSLYLDRDQWGVVMDALIQHKDHSEARKVANQASNSDTRAEMCDLLIGMIGDAASKPPQVEAKRQTGEGADHG